MNRDANSALRSFSRCFTERLGVLDESFLGRGRPLSLARLIFEIGPQGCGVSKLRKQLQLDPGYLSRSLSTLQEEGLLKVSPDPEDGRRRIVKLTARGRREWKAIDRESSKAATRILDSLSARQQTELAAVLGRAEELLSSATVCFESVDPMDDDAQWALGCYVAEITDRFGKEFDPGQAFMAEADPSSSRSEIFVVAYRGTEVVGCGGVQSLEDGVGEIKRMWVADSMRGLGIGRRLLVDLESRARDAGHSIVRLDTNTALNEAIAMYESAGYYGIERYNDNPYARLWFEKVL